MAEIKRHEIKYIISLREAELLKYRLRALLRPDSHVRADGSYFIRSLYFDDTDYRAYHEKIADAHDAELTVESSVEKGTTVRVHFQ